MANGYPFSTLATKQGAGVDIHHSMGHLDKTFHGSLAHLIGKPVVTHHNSLLDTLLCETDFSSVHQMPRV